MSEFITITDSPFPHSAGTWVGGVSPWWVVSTWTPAAIRSTSGPPASLACASLLLSSCCFSTHSHHSDVKITPQAHVWFSIFLYHAAASSTLCSYCVCLCVCAGNHQQNCTWLRKSWGYWNPLKKINNWNHLMRATALTWIIESFREAEGSSKKCLNFQNKFQVNAKMNYSVTESP